LKYELWIFLLLLTPSVLFARDIKPGFSCDGNLNFSEMIICNDSYLSSFDNYLNILYKQYMRLSFSPDTLKKHQLAWLKKRNSCKKHDCIYKLYNERASEIIDGIKDIDSGFTALEPINVVRFFTASQNNYTPVSINETINKPSGMNLFPETFFELNSAKIESFERIERQKYRFQYSYQVSYKKLSPYTITGSFLVDASGQLLAVNPNRNSGFEKMLNEIVKASRADDQDHLEIMHSVLIELRSEGIATAGYFLKYFNMDPVKTLTGAGVIPCSRHDGQLYLVKGSVLDDTLECSYGHEIINTYDGNDEIDGSWGDEIIAAGKGADTIVGSWGNEMVYAGPGNDHIKGDHGNLIVLYGKSWGDDVVSDSCSVIVFSAENSPEDILWENKQRTIINKNTGDRIQLKHPCRKVHFSNISFE
jgi:uncharacterized protein